MRSVTTLVLNFLAVMFVAALLPAPGMAEPAARLFFLHSYHKGQICSLPQEEGLLADLAEHGLEEGNGLVIERFYMDTKQTYVTEDAVRRRGTMALARIRTFAPDVVVVFDDNALHAVLPALANGPLPVVFTGINGDLGRYGLPRNVTGIYERGNLVGAIRTMSHILPGLNRVMVIFDDSYAVRSAEAAIRRQLRTADLPVAVDVRRVATMAQFTAIIAEANADERIGGLVPVVTTLTDADGRRLDAPAIYRWFLEHSRKPAFAFNDYLVELGLFGGVPMDYREMGARAGAMVRAILGGSAPATLPVQVAESSLLSFNLARARQLGITLPDDILTAAARLYTSMPVRQEPSRKKIFVVQSYEANVGCGRLMERGMMEVLRQAGFEPGINCTIDRYCLKSRYTNLTREAIAAEAARALTAISDARPDAVVVFDDNAINHVMLPLVDGPVPVLFAGMNIAPEHYNERVRFMESREKPGHNVTGVTEEAGWVESLRLMRELVPTARTMVVLCSAGSPFLLRIAEDFEKWLADDADACPFKVKAVEYAETFRHYQELVRRYERDPEVDIIFTLTPVSFRKQDGSGTTEREVMEWLLPNQRKPGGTWEADWVRYGFAASAGIDLVQCGRQLGRQLVKVLYGTPAGDLPIERPADSYIALNLARLRQLGITVPVDILEAAEAVYEEMEFYPRNP